MNNVILKATLSFTWKVIVAYSVYILLRGHNEPGGGFIGGLLLALGVILRGILQKDRAGSSLFVEKFPKILASILVFFMLVVMWPMIFGQPVLKGLWTDIWVPIAGKFSTVLLFDVAVFFVVAASAVYAHAVLVQNSQGEGR